jgi:hypothetical protein
VLAVGLCVCVCVCVCTRACCKAGGRFECMRSCPFLCFAEPVSFVFISPPPVETQAQTFRPPFGVVPKEGQYYVRKHTASYLTTRDELSTLSPYALYSAAIKQLPESVSNLCTSIHNP